MQYKEILKYISIILFIVLIGTLLHVQYYVEKKYKDEVYDLKVEVESLRETIDKYGKGEKGNEYK